MVADLAGRGTVVIARLVLTPSALSPEARPEAVADAGAPARPDHEPAAVARRRRARRCDSRRSTVEDLLLRPSVRIDYRRLETFVAGKAIVVTGGGGSIGAEICDRMVTFGAARLLVIENSEPALHAVVEALATKQSQQLPIDGRIADVRDRERIMRLVAQFKPDIVFHAAALKHVPLLETDWDEGIKTNVFGSVNVADAAAAAGAAAMVMISTDKAIEPVSVLGATKRFAEMYCQALDADFARLRRAASRRCA